MAEAVWTEEQKNAIDTRGCTLLVAAAAGAGKTAVLVERIIKRIIDEKSPVDIDKLLVVTFTHAAASEMRERIGDAISRELEKNPDSVRLQSQIAILGKSYITTMHGFCLDVIKNNFHMIDLDPAFRITDSTESVLLKQEVLDEMFDEKYEEGNCSEEFLNLVESYGGGKSDKKLQEIVLKLYEFSQSTPWPDSWLKSSGENFNVDDDFDFGSSKWAKVLMNNISLELSGVSRSMERAAELLSGAAGLEPYLNHFKGELIELNELLKSSETSWNNMIQGFSTIGFERLPRCGKDADKETQEKVRDIRDGVKKQVNAIKDGLLSPGIGNVGQEMKKLYPAMDGLSNLAIEFGSRFLAKKREKGVIDFNDIEHYCIEILTSTNENGTIVPSGAALNYRERFEEIYIDEYQDSNDVQELILTTISREGSASPNLFMVGDVKQSIYRFRQAKPELFLEKYDRYGDTGRERKILLYKNFRSRAEVLDGANYIFKGIMSKNIGELDYNDVEKLNLGASYETLNDNENICGGPVEVHIIEIMRNEKEADEDSEEEDLDSIQLEARMVSGRINGLIHGNFMVFDKNIKGYRKIEYRDIVILMRSTAYSAPVFEVELMDRGIPVYADAGSGYFEVMEVQTIMSLLRIIDNPMQDIPLLAVLRSPVASFSPEELMDVRITDSKKSFYEALKLKAFLDDSDVSKKAKYFLKELEKWRDKSINMPISEFIWYLYTDTGYYAYAGAMPGGVQRQANLKILFERAREYEETSFKGLFNFINFINRLRNSSGDMGSAKTLGENENVVRIMSIHKSKGLEFPVVIVSGLGRRFNLKDLEGGILFHHDLGFGPDFVDCKRRISYSTIIKQALKKKMKLESYSEEMRILYVAFTRAKEKLIITGTVGDISKAFPKWIECINYPGNKVAEYQILKGVNFLDWICPALLKHRDLGEFRKKSGLQEISVSSIIDDPSKWEIKPWTRKEILEGSTAGIIDTEAAAEVPGEKSFKDEIQRRLDFEYPYNMSSKLPAKLSVTELKRMFGTSLDDEYTQNIFVPALIKKPLFLEGKGNITAAERGTIMHLVMQHVDTKKAPGTNDIVSLMNDLVSMEFMTVDQESTVDIQKITGFFESPLGIRMIKSKNLKREIPFYMEIKGTEVYKDLSEDRYGSENILLQGIIDCYFEEDDGLVLIDYKTDYIPIGKMDIIKEKYRLQIDYYTRALTRLTGKSVKERYIYLFYNGETLKY